MEISLDLGGLVSADNVQTLASKNLNSIPTQYIRPELKFDENSFDKSHQIPVIDMSKLDSEDESSKLHQACKDWSFFQLINHGISETVEKIEEVSEEFFKLSLEEKMVYAQQPNNIQGYGQPYVVSGNQKLDWNDMLLILAQPLTQRDMRFWPTFPTKFRVFIGHKWPPILYIGDVGCKIKVKTSNLASYSTTTRSALEVYSYELLRVEINLLRWMAKNLGLDQDELVVLFENGIQIIRINYYPPCQHADKVIGISPHSDTMGITLLVQINDVQGLQIKKNDKWVPIKPLPGAIIVNIGDTIEILSNGEYKSVEHRVVVNPDRDRLSIAGFHTTNAKSMVGPLSSLLKEGKEAKYKTMGFEDFAKLVAKNKLDGKILLDQLRIK